jgi:hypothetical protein
MKFYRAMAKGGLEEFGQGNTKLDDKIKTLNLIEKA